MPNTKPLTGYPSVDKPWMKYYPEGAWERATNIPENRTVWDVIEKRLIEYSDIPAIEYFGRTISRDAFRESVYEWAKAFRALGIRTDEVVVFYGPFFPAICAMTFAMNVIGATPYFLKLAISPEALEEETRDARFAVVFDDMWDNVKSAFAQDRFEKVIVVSAADDMPPVKKALLSLKRAKDGSTPHGGKYLTCKQALALAASYKGEVKADFVPNRSAFITSSSGTTVGGVVKGCVATNEATIAQLYMGEASDIQYYPGDKCLTNLPPTASTSLNCLFLLAIYKGMTVIVDPRVSENDFYNQLINQKPNLIISTGSMWEQFWIRIAAEKAQKRFNFDYAKYWIIGGEGIGKEKLVVWNKLMQECSAPCIIFNGYGLSEVFSVVSVDAIKADSNKNGSSKATGVGVPYAGFTIGVFDESGNELPYNQRGELWVKSRSVFKGYYNKPELTAKTLVDGWVHTGDLASVDENGFLYIYGRLSDRMTAASGETLYLFDVAEAVKEIADVDDAMVFPVNGDYARNELTVHLTWAESLSRQAKNDALREIDAKLRSLLPTEIKVLGYAEHEGMLPYSPTTLKKDRNKMSRQTTGYKAIRDGRIVEIEIG